MNEELQKTVNEALLGIIDNATSVKDFMLSEIPEVIQQLLLWKFWESIIYNLIGFSIIFTVIYSIRIVYKKWEAIEENDMESIVAGGGIVIGLVSILLAFMFINLDWLKIWLAPKIYLLEYAKELIK